MILFIGTLFRLLLIVRLVILSPHEAHIVTIRVNSIRTIRAMTGYIESPFGIGQLVVRQARFATS